MHGEEPALACRYTAVGTAHIRAADGVNSAVDLTGASKINRNRTATDTKG